MAINILPRSQDHPLWVEEEEYDRLVSRTGQGWSRCDDEREWLAKLHYLRSGFNAGRLEKEQFEERETRLVMEWLRG